MRRNVCGTPCRLLRLVLLGPRMHLAACGDPLGGKTPAANCWGNSRPHIFRTWVLTSLPPGPASTIEAWLPPLRCCVRGRKLGRPLCRMPGTFGRPLGGLLLSTRSSTRERTSIWKIGGSPLRSTFLFCCLPVAWWHDAGLGLRVSLAGLCPEPQTAACPTRGCFHLSLGNWRRWCCTRTSRFARRLSMVSLGLRTRTASPACTRWTG
mmetsp:Transcript_26798/g.70425  ORF Transcript_26798/g.70425 Transcript_26798/m.70425 type:complete len:208 (+) Transcript_26798:466-1089(+)